MTNIEPERTSRKCDYCGARNQSVSMHSGVYECDKCWDYRKMDRPAASHWAKVGTEFLSNVDMYDLMYYFQKAGLTKEEANTMLSAAHKLRDYSQKLIDVGPEHRWPKEEKTDD